MEIANDVGQQRGVRLANPADKLALTKLLRHANFVHLHADWRLPSDWIGDPGFFVIARPSGRLSACLAGTADPAPAAWIRLAAIRYRDEIIDSLDRLMDATCVALHQQQNYGTWMVGS